MTRTDEDFREIIAQLSIEQKVGQIFMLGIDPALTPHQARHFRREHHLGGVFLTRRNLPNVADAVKLLNHLRDTDPVLPPPLLAIDEEGGFVSNIDHLTTTAPCSLAQATAALELRAKPSSNVGTDIPRACARAMGEKLRALGINTVFAPVADVNDLPENPVIGIRSFGDDPQAVAACVEAAAEGYRMAGIASCLKHFPGHGHTAIDSHLDLPAITRPAEEMEQTDLVPFRAGVRAGAPLVMSGHVACPAMGEDRPATLSSEILHDLLRFKVGFGGAVVTDAMEMKAAGGTFGERPGPAELERMEAAAIRALNAGADLLLYAFGGEEAIFVLHAVVRAVKKGDVMERRLDEALSRVFRVRASFGESIIDEKEREAILSRRHEAVLRVAHESSIVLLSGAIPAAPAAGPRRLAVIHPVAKEPMRALAIPEFVEAMRPVEVKAIRVGFDPDADEIGGAIAEARAFLRPGDLAAVFTQSRGPINAGQKRLAAMFVDAFEQQAICVATMSPHDAGAFPTRCAAVFATLGGEAPRLRALARVLRGDLPPVKSLAIRVALPKA